MKKELEGYMTLEAAMIFPAVFALVIMLLYVTFFLYDKCRMTQDLYTAAYRQSIARGENTPDAKVDTSNYFMLSSCSAESGGGNDITASAKGEMAPALLTGTGDGGTVWELKVTMKARKTDPPRSFRRFRRVTAIAQQALGQ
jgi:Flp pilus assembly protein TadG